MADPETTKPTTKEMLDWFEKTIGEYVADYDDPEASTMKKAIIDRIKRRP